ncbi:MAG: hypothetical protein AAF266_10965, partial [Planctomycetota bacterium]
MLEYEPELLADRSVVFDLALEEYCERRNRGETIDPRDFRQRFESIDIDLAASIERLVSVEDALRHGGLDRPGYDWPSVGADFHGFRIVEELGRGGYARVYLCEELELGRRTVVLKIAPGASQEAEWLGRMEHRCIVPVHSVRVVDDPSATLICMPFSGRATLASSESLEAPIATKLSWLAD